MGPPAGTIPPMSEAFRLDTPGGRVDGLVDLPDLPGRRPAIILCHGFKGFMGWGFFPPLAELLVRRGFVTVRFNFSGSGMRPGEDRVADLEAFRRNTYSRELAELEAVAEAVVDGHLPGTDRVDPERLGLFGHSRGGAIALLAAAEPTWRTRIGVLVTWAAVARLDRWSEAEKEAWREAGEIHVTNARTGQQLPLGLELLEDVENHGERLDPARAAATRHAPWLIAHGSEDESVPVSEARLLHRQAAGTGREVSLHVVDGTGHTFGARHPFAGPTPHLIEVMNATQAWFRSHLGDG